MNKQMEAKISLLNVPEDTQSIRYVLSLLLFFGIEQINVIIYIYIYIYHDSDLQVFLLWCAK